MVTAGARAPLLRMLSFECLGGVALEVVSFTLTEALSDVFEAKVVVQTHESAAELAPRVLGQPARLGFGGQAHGGSALGLGPVDELASIGRFVHGIIRTVESRGTSESIAGAPSYAELTLVPKLALLGNRKTSRVFQEVGVDEVVDTILGEWGVPRRWALSNRPAAWLYNVQHQETDLDFLKRILAAEGIFFFFERAPLHAGVDAVPSVVFADAVAAYGGREAGAIPELLPAVRRDRSAQRYDRLFRFSETQRVSTGTVLIRDHTATQAHADTVAGASSPGGHGHRLHTTYEYLPARPMDIHPRLGTIALEQLRRDSRVYAGEASAPLLAAGHLFRVEGRTDASLDGTYVLTSMRTRGHEPQLVGDATADPDTLVQELASVRATDAFRPARVHRREHHGFDTAVVVGPPNAPSACDSLGRVRVRFSWDHPRPGIDDAEVDWTARSTWLRVAQPWNGAGHGAFFLPRVGAEVLVGYVGGDINRPVIVGSLPNSLNPPPFSLPNDIGLSGIVSRGLSSDGQSEIVFDDTGGRESLRVVSQRKLMVRARQDIEQHAGRNELTDVKESSVLNVGQMRREHIDGDRAVEVAGKSTIDVAREAHCTVAGATRVALAATDVHVKGDATVHFDARLEGALAGDLVAVVAGETWLEHAGSLAVLVGKGEEPANYTVRCDGATTHLSRSLFEIASEEQLSLRCGESVITLTPQAVEIKAAKLRVDAGIIELVGDELQLQGKSFARIDAPKVFALSRGASLSLTTSAKLDGEKVQLGTPPDPSDGPAAVKPRAPSTRIRLVDQDGNPVADEPCVVRLSDGTSRTGVTNRAGIVKFDDLVGAATVDFVELSNWEKG